MLAASVSRPPPVLPTPSFCLHDADHTLGIPFVFFFVRSVVGTLGISPEVSGRWPTRRLGGCSRREPMAARLWRRLRGPPAWAARTSGPSSTAYALRYRLCVLCVCVFSVFVLFFCFSSGLSLPKFNFPSGLCLYVPHTRMFVCTCVCLHVFCFSNGFSWSNIPSGLIYVQTPYICIYRCVFDLFLVFFCVCFAGGLPSTSDQPAVQQYLSCVLSVFRTEASLSCVWFFSIRRQTTTI